MEKHKIKFIMSSTEELHDEVTGIYESLMDEEMKEAVKFIDTLIAKAKHLKSNLLTKES